MDDIREPWSGDADEDPTAQLLRLAGPRSPVPAARTARVRAAVQARWQHGTRRRAIRRRIVAASAFVAATAVAGLVVGRFGLAGSRGVPGDPVAVVERVSGRPLRVIDSRDGRLAAALTREDPIRVGEWIETDARASVALRFPDGTSVRLDAGSRARPVASSTIELLAGAVYVDTGRESGGFEVRTASATARDIGTQFEVRLVEGAVRLRVRTGVVELSDRTRSVSGRAGTEITLTASGAVSRPIASYGSEWDWTARVSPPLHIEGMSLARFLDRLGREHGWAVRFADAALAREASNIVLHGSVDGLPPHDAVDVAITTSGLRHRLENGELVVLPGPDVK